MATIRKISANLWFDNQAEQAATFYTGVFKNSKINRVSRYAEAGKEIHKKQPGSIMTVDFTLAGSNFVALNGGPEFKFNESVSFVVNCKDQKEVDYFWTKLGEGGDPTAQQCGWLKDKFGLSWQIVPQVLADLLTDEDRSKVEYAMDKMMKMKKIEIDQLTEANQVEA